MEQKKEVVHLTAVGLAFACSFSRCMEGEVIAMQDIFKFEIDGTDQDGKITGQFLPTGLRSLFTERFAQWGYNLPTSIYTRAAQ